MGHGRRHIGWPHVGWPHAGHTAVAHREDKRWKLLSSQRTRAPPVHEPVRGCEQQRGGDERNRQGGNSGCDVEESSHMRLSVVPIGKVRSPFALLFYPDAALPPHGRAAY